MGQADSISPQRTRPRVLLVEGDDGVRRSLHLLLHGSGYDVRSYSAAGPLLYDPGIGDAAFLVSAHQLPDSDGLDVRFALREAGWRGRSVLITAHATDHLREAARAAGYDAVLEKPLRPRELIGELA